MAVQVQGMSFGLLINAVELHKCLYDKSDKQYKNILTKDKAWDEIAEIIGIPKDDCKRKWNYLREKFNKELKKRELPSGSGAALEDEWPYMESLMFLKEFIQPRKTKSNYFTQDKVDISDETETDDSATPKKSKPDPFAETCLKFQEIMDKFSQRNRPLPKAVETVDDHFFKTLRLLYDDLPGPLKDTARMEMFKYISLLRTS